MLDKIWEVNKQQDEISYGAIIFGDWKLFDFSNTEIINYSIEHNLPNKRSDGRLFKNVKVDFFRII